MLPRFSQYFTTSPPHSHCSTITLLLSHIGNPTALSPYYSILFNIIRSLLNLSHSSNASLPHPFTAPSSGLTAPSSYLRCYITMPTTASPSRLVCSHYHTSHSSILTSYNAPLPHFSLPIQHTSAALLLLSLTASSPHIHCHHHHSPKCLPYHTFHCTTCDSSPYITAIYLSPLQPPYSPLSLSYSLMLHDPTPTAPLSHVPLLITALPTPHCRTSAASSS